MSEKKKTVGEISYPEVIEEIVKTMEYVDADEGEHGDVVVVAPKGESTDQDPYPKRTEVLWNFIGLALSQC